MKQLADNQDVLKELTSQAIDDLAEKNEKVIDQQKEILQVSSAHRAIVETNLHELMREKGLIRSGQMEVARMIDHLKTKLDDSLLNLKQQSKQMKDNQAALLNDLSNLQTNAFHLSDKLSETTEYILSQNEIASTQFDQTVKRLAEINDMIEKLQNLVRFLEGSVDKRFTWITHELGNIELVLQHVGYLLCGMLVLVFVNAPTFYRLFFISSVPINFACTLLKLRHVNLLELTQMLSVVFAFNLIRQILMSTNFKNVLTFKKKEQADKPNKSTEADDATRETSEEYDTFNETDFHRDNNNDYSHLNGLKNRHRLDRSVTSSRASNRSFDARGFTPFNTSLNDRTRCIALTTKGDRCKNAAVPNEIYCRRHEN